MASSLTSKQLTAMEKALVATVDDESKTEAIQGVFAKFKKALGDGDAVTTDDVDEMLTEVMVGKSNEDPGEVVDEPTDPLAPIFKALYDEIAKTGIAKSAKGQAALQAVFEKAYTAALGQLDGAIEATVEATAAELNKAWPDKGKGKKKPPADDDGDEDCEDDMQKVLNKFGAGKDSPIIKKMNELTAEVAELRHDKELGLFTKRATEVGAPEMAEDLLALHKFSPDLAKRMEKRLGSQHQLLLKSNTWAAEIGGEEGSGGSDAYGQLTGFAQELQKSNDPKTGKKMSFSKAFTLACEQHQDVYAQYRRETAN